MKSSFTLRTCFNYENLNLHLNRFFTVWFYSCFLMWSNFEKLLYCHTLNIWKASVWALSCFCKLPAWFMSCSFKNLILKEYVSTLQWKLIENVKGSNGALLELGFTRDFRVQKRPKKLKGWKKVQKISFQIWTPWWLQFTSTFLSPKTWETSAAFGTATKECWWCPLKASHGLHGRPSNIVSIKMSSNKKLCLIFREEEEITVPHRHIELWYG